MAILNGTDGAVEIAAGAIAEVKEFSVNYSANVLDASVHGSAAMVHIAGATNWGGSLSCLYDSANANQTSIVPGNTITVSLYPDGNVTGNPRYTGSAIVESVELSEPYGEIPSKSISFTGSGALTIDTV